MSAAESSHDGSCVVTSAYIAGWIDKVLTLEPVQSGAHNKINYVAFFWWVIFLCYTTTMNLGFPYLSRAEQLLQV